MRVINHLLTPSYADVALPEVHAHMTVNFSMNRIIKPTFIVVHYTAGGSAYSTANWCRSPESGVSYHCLIDRDGAILQLVPFHRRAWHAGVSNFENVFDLNSHSIGIAFANWGILERNAAGSLCAWPQGYGAPVASGTPWLRAPHKSRQEDPASLWPYWEAYTGPQLRSFSLLVKVLAEAYPITWIIGHDDCAPGRKVDPGPGFGCLPLLMNDWADHWLSNAWAW